MCAATITCRGTTAKAAAAEAAEGTGSSEQAARKCQSGIGSSISISWHMKKRRVCQFLVHA